MTDRVHSLVVVLDKDYRADDVKALCKAISQFKGVVAVGQEIVNHECYMAEQRALQKLREQMQGILWPE